MPKQRHEGQCTKITTRTPYGTTSDMVVKNLENGAILAKDDYGLYITDAKNIDNGLADPYRFDFNFRNKNATSIHNYE